MSPVQASCPACGAAITFKVGSAIVTVCAYCRSVVARGDRQLEDLGKVADLIETGSILDIWLQGRYEGVPFELTGRAQLRHEAGGVWDEWYAAFDDGQWGWLAEAQGKFYLTVKKEASGLPPYDVLQIGGTYDGMKVVELAICRRVSPDNSPSNACNIAAIDCLLPRGAAAVPSPRPAAYLGNPCVSPRAAPGTLEAAEP